MPAQAEDDAPAMMRALRFHDTTGLASLRLEQVARPLAPPGGLLVRVHAAGLNPFDFYAVHGLVNAYVRFTLPTVLGRDFAGVVEQVGPGATGFAIGDTVFGYAAADAEGTFADYVAVPATQAALRPRGWTHAEAASLPNVLMAAWDGLFSATSGMDLQAGQTILVNGAAGGIGSVAVQLAGWRGAHVIGTASFRNLDLVRQLGAAAHDYAAPGWERSLPEIDAVLDTTDGSSAALLCGLIRRGGRYVGMRGLPDDGFAARWAARGVTCVVASGPSSAGEFAAMAQALADGAVRPLVTACHPLDAFIPALTAMGSGHARGKQVFTLAPDPPAAGKV